MMAFGNRVLQTGTSTTYIYPFKWYSVASSTGSGAKYCGAVAQTIDYYPYGALRISDGTGASEKRKFIGQFGDESGLDYFNARYYSPTQGQFISEDPSFFGDQKQVRQVTGRDQQEFLADPQLANSYSYGRDNPITQRDPDGKIIPLLGILAVYSAASIAVDLYDAYNMNIRYGSVVSPEVKNETNFKLGYDAALAGISQVAALPRIGLEGYGVALDVLSTTQDVLDTYLSPQIYKNVNNEINPNTKKTILSGSKSQLNHQAA
jgi:RHS repeat-associated protein